MTSAQFNSAIQVLHPVTVVVTTHCDGREQNHIPGEQQLLHLDNDIDHRSH